jgi:hypothetical protein
VAERRRAQLIVPLRADELDALRTYAAASCVTLAEFARRVLAGYLVVRR